MEDIRLFLFFFWVQSFLQVATGVGLFDFKFSWKRVLAAGIIHGVFVWLIRSLYVMFDIPFGTHSLILLVLLIIIIKLVVGTDWGIATGASLTSMTLVMLGSGLAV